MKHMRFWVIPKTEKKYDEYGEHWQHAEEYEKAKHQRQTDFGGYAQGDFSDFFESIKPGNKTISVFGMEVI